MLHQIKATEQEQTLLLKLLTLNAKHLSPSYKPKRDRSESSFKLSFLLPLGPLTQLDIGKLNSDFGCIVCGNKTVSRCSQCLSVSYCGKECQTAHWKEHKPLCQSLKNGIWRTVTFALQDPLAQAFPNMHMAMFNFRTMEPIEVKDDGKPPENIHGDNAFLIKIQKRVTAVPADSMMIYDRQRSFNVHLLLSQDQDVFRQLEDEMRRTGYMGLKIYRWAKRVGDMQLSICVDKLPTQDPAIYGDLHVVFSKTATTLDEVDGWLARAAYGGLRRRRYRYSV